MAAVIDLLDNSTVSLVVAVVGFVIRHKRRRRSGRPVARQLGAVEVEVAKGVADGACARGSVCEVIMNGAVGAGEVVHGKTCCDGGGSR